MSRAGDLENVEPLGRYHSKTRCWRCGTDSAELTMVVVSHTRAWGWACTNRIACERRYYRQRQLDLFGVPSP